MTYYFHASYDCIKILNKVWHFVVNKMFVSFQSVGWININVSLGIVKSIKLNNECPLIFNVYVLYKLKVIIVNIVVNK